MKTHVTWMAVACAVAFATGCGADGGGAADDAAQPADSNADSNADSTGKEDANPIGKDTIDDTSITEPPLVVGRTPRRVSVQQLGGVIHSLTGGIDWLEDYGTGPIQMLELLAGSLGAPDYRLVTSENIEPNLMIAKFVADAAQQVCPDWVQAEFDRPAQERTLIRHADPASTAEEDVITSLQLLERRAFGVASAPGEPTERVQRLAELFAELAGSAAGNQSAVRGWTAVCVAVFSDAEFVLY